MAEKHEGGCDYQKLVSGENVFSELVKATVEVEKEYVQLLRHPDSRRKGRRMKAHLFRHCYLEVRRHDDYDLLRQATVVHLHRWMAVLSTLWPLILQSPLQGPFSAMCKYNAQKPQYCTIYNELRSTYIYIYTL